MKPTVQFHGTLQVPGDKSISHRALIFSALTNGTSKIKGLSPAADCRSTSDCLRALGLTIERDEQDTDLVHIRATGLDGLGEPETTLDAGNSGTTIRLLSGLVAGRAIKATFDGDDSLRKRPMSRVLQHLGQMGARVDYTQRDNYAPFTIKGGALQGKEFALSVASAQVQTAVLLAGLQAEGETVVRLPAAVRDHTERILSHIGLVLNQSPDGLETRVQRLQSPLPPFEILVPADISSAAFFMVAAACAPGSHLILKNVGLNPGRTLVIEVLKEMGADISVEDTRDSANEPVGTVIVRGSRRLQATRVAGDRVATGIDEIPALALAGALCDGRFTVADARELRVKESDRIAAISENLRRAGAEVSEHADGFEVVGRETLPGGSEWKTFGDHRLAMTGLVASLLCTNALTIDDTVCVAVSYPNFEDDLSLVTQRN